MTSNCKWSGTYIIYLYCAFCLIWAFKVLSTRASHLSVSCSRILQQTVGSGDWPFLLPEPLLPKRLCFNKKCCGAKSYQRAVTKKRVTPFIAGQDIHKHSLWCFGACTNCSNDPVNNFLSLMADYVHLIYLLMISFYRRSKLVNVPADDIISEHT